MPTTETFYDRTYRLLGPATEKAVRVEQPQRDLDYLHRLEQQQAKLRRTPFALPPVHPVNSPD